MKFEDIVKKVSSFVAAFIVFLYANIHMKKEMKTWDYFQIT